MNKFKFIILIFSIVLSAFNAFAQTGNWPSKPITLVVPFAAGGSTDITLSLIHI
jgi:tripartite-type tricarboxylate transporter receptor subunit TctC